MFRLLVLTSRNCFEFGSFPFHTFSFIAIDRIQKMNKIVYCCSYSYCILEKYSDLSLKTLSIICWPITKKWTNRTLRLLLALQIYFKDCSIIFWLAVTFTNRIINPWMHFSCPIRLPQFTWSRKREFGGRIKRYRKVWNLRRV